MSDANLLLTGSGGQGMILAGIILARAGLKAGLNAVQTQSYGPEARGGASRAEVILSADPIDYPKVETADVVLAMTQEACDKYAGQLRPGGLLIVDPMHVQSVPDTPARIVRAAITQAARAATGRDLSANVVALGVIQQLTGVVPVNHLASAVQESVPRGTGEANGRALAAGIALGTEPGALS